MRRGEGEVGGRAAGAPAVPGALRWEQHALGRSQLVGVGHRSPWASSSWVVLPGEESGSWVESATID